MSDEIIDLTSEHIKISSERTTDDGMNLPDPAFVDESETESLQMIEDRRKDLENIPPFPTEWQQDYDDEEEEKNNSTQLPLNVSLKKEEVNKLIKKYKRYLRSNLSEIRRLDNENNEG